VKECKYCGSDECNKTCVSKEEMKEFIKVVNDEIIGNLQYALFKLDDKPHQSWRRMLACAYIFDDDEAADSCKIMLEIGYTPETLRDAVAFAKQHGFKK
jgi:hypothetical protein